MNIGRRVKSHRFEEGIALTRLLAALISLIVVASLAPACAGTRTVVEWTFDKPGDTLGWTAGSGVEGLTVRYGCLVGKTVARDPLIHGPMINIPAKPNQFIEVRMKCSVDGSGELFWANTTEPPYDGFRPAQMRQIQFKAGEFRVYRVLPFWQAEQRIIRLRLDPPENAEFAVDYIRVLETGTSMSEEALFDFTQGDPGWAVIGDGKASYSKEGVSLFSAGDGPGELIYVSPLLDLDASSLPWLTVMAKAVGVDSFVLHWITDDLPGVRSHTIRVKPYQGWHSYNVHIEKIPDWQGRISMMAIRVAFRQGKFLGQLPRSVSLRYAGASDTPVGPPALAVTHFGTRDAVNRSGKAAVVQATITNEGGEPAEDVRAILRVPENRGKRAAAPDVPGGRIQGRSLHVLPVLRPGESRTLTWQVNALGVGWLSRCRLDVFGPNVRALHESTSLRWHPAVRSEKASYVPEPKPVRGDFEVGMYYYPGWPTYTRWTVLDDFPERRPVLGYYREGDPEVADWHIKWMVEHGVTFIVYDWYWSKGARHLEHAIHDGFFNAKYHDKIKFCLLWANHNAPGTSSAEDMVNVTNYWLDNYFLRDDYMKVDGKPVVVIFSPHRLWDDMGVNAVKAAFDKSREMAKARGLNGIYFVACSYPGRGGLENIEKAGYDAVSGYNYPSAGDNGQLVAPYADMVSGYVDFWNQIQDNTSLPYIPVTEPGWDARPWHGPNTRVRTGKTPELFAQMLRNSKEFVENRKTVGPKMVLIEAWNEFGEGDYVEPHQEWGFGHVDAIRDVFTNAPKEHVDLIPQDVGLGPYELEKPIPATAWEFDDPKHPGWDAIQNLEKSRVENGRLITESNGSDPAIYGEAMDIDSKRFRRAEIRMKVDRGRGAQLFWAAKSRGFVEASSLRWEINPDGQFHVYELDLGASPAWKGRIGAFRLDPTDAAGARIEVDYVRLIPSE